jgi:hypothetical protein
MSWEFHSLTPLSLAAAWQDGLRSFSAAARAGSLKGAPWLKDENVRAFGDRVAE